MTDLSCDKLVFLVLNESSASEITKILYELRSRDSDEAALALEKCMTGDSVLIDHEIAYILGQMKKSVSIPFLKKIVKSERNDIVRHEAIEALGNFEDVSLIDFLKDYLEDKADIIRESAILSISKLRDCECLLKNNSDGSLQLNPNCIPINGNNKLVNKYNSDDNVVFYNDENKCFGSNNSGDNVVSYNDENNLVDSIVNKNDKQVYSNKNTIYDKIYKESNLVKNIDIKNKKNTDFNNMKNIKNEKIASDNLISKFGTRDPAFPFKGDFNTALKMFHSCNIEDQYKALFYFRDLNTPEAVIALGGGFDFKSELLKHEIAYVFGQMQNPLSVDYLIKVLENEQEKNIVRHEAAEALGNIGDEKSLNCLKNFINSEIKIIRESARVGLGINE